MNNTSSPKPDRSRYGHDVSMRRIFSCPCGMLLPVYHDLAIEGDKYKINSSTFIRTEAVDTAAFIRLKHHLDWFFVPIKQIYCFWNEFFNGTQDVMTSFGLDANGKTPTNYSLPTISIYTYLRDLGTDSSLITQTAGSQAGIFYSLDEFGIPKVWNAARLMDLLGYGSVTKNFVLQYSGSATQNFTDFWFPLSYLAYHKIFHSHYLNSQYFANDVSLYNVDKYYGQSLPRSLAEKIISTIHYRPYRKDYFTDIQPAPIFNENFVNSVSSFFNNIGFIGDNHISYDSLAESNSLAINVDSDLVSNSSNYASLPNAGSTEGVNLNFSNELASIGSLRSMFAIDKLLRVTASTGSHYADQTLAHLGFKVPEGVSDEAYFLGSQTTDIIINEVVATASTDAKNSDGNLVQGATIGDIAGKAFGSTTPSKDIEFTCPTFGVIMGISSIEPLCDYSSIRVEIPNRYLLPFDFWRPETDSLGMQPLFGGYGNANYVGTSNSPAHDLVGWQNRHSELKQKYDVVNESMFATHRNSWVGFKESLYYDASFDDMKFYPTNFVNFYIAPQYTNNVFLASVPCYLKTGLERRTGEWFSDPNLNPNNIYASDNFLINMQMNVYKTSYMSENTLPKFL